MKRQATTQPTEVSLNLNTMREQVMRGFIDANRATLKVFEDIDAAERVLAAHATGTFPHDLLRYHAGHASNFGEIPSSSGNGNGNGRGPGGPHREPKQLTHRTYKNALGTGKQVKAYCLAQLAALGPDERLTSTQLIESCMKAGLLDHAMPATHSRAFVTGVLRRAAASGEVKSYIGKGSRLTAYRLRGHGATPIEEKPAAGGQSTPVVVVAPSMALGAPIPPTTLLREAVIELMLRHEGEITAPEITQALVAHGWPRKRGKGMLADHITQMLIYLRRKGVIKTRKTKEHSSKGGLGTNYHTLRRPSKVTRLVKL